jgi:hypothetical protein
LAAAEAVEAARETQQLGSEVEQEEVVAAHTLRISSKHLIYLVPNPYLSDLEELAAHQ